jgi:adenine-specific DNA-methyltransferase
MEQFAVWALRTPPLEVLRSGKAIVEKHSNRLGEKRRKLFATAFTSRLVAHYWTEIQSGHDHVWSLPAPLVESDPDILATEFEWLAARLGRAAALLDPVTAGYLVGTTYATALPPEIRARLGAYYTPPALTSRLLDQVTSAGIDWDLCTIVDPACGGGAFLAPIAQRIAKHLSHLEPIVLVEAVATRVRGLEIDPFAAWMSQVFVEAVMLPTCRAARSRLPVLVEVRDSLSIQSVAETFDLVIGNPPYGRVTLPSDLRVRYSKSLYGHANMYGVFTELALRLVKAGGLVAYVTPTSFLAGQYFKRLRGLLAHEAPPVAVDFIAQRKGVFDGVLQEALLATYRRNGQAQPAPVSLVTPVDEGTARVASVADFSLPRGTDQPWLIPRSVEQVSLVERMREMPHRLADWGYSVSTGPLVWNRYKGQLRVDGVPGCLPIVWAESVASEGRFVLRAIKQNHKPFFRPLARDNWLVVQRGCVLLQRTTAKEQPRRLIAAVLPYQLLRKYGGVVVENHLNMVVPVRSPLTVRLETVAAFLNSTVADQAFRCVSGSVAVSAYELETLPLPPPESLERLDSAMERGASREEIDRVCSQLYGMRC